MENLINEEEFKIQKKWQDFNKYYIALFICAINFFVKIWLINKFLFDLPLWVIEVIMPVYLLFLPLVFCLIMFRRPKRAPILNTKLIAKSIAVLVTSFYTAILTFFGILSLTKSHIPYFTVEGIVQSAAKIIGIYCILQIVAVFTLFPISFLYNKYFTGVNP